MKLRWKRLALALAALALLGALVSASGLVPIRASGGHFAVVQAALEFSMHRSVATYAAGTVVPALDDPAMVLKGAGQYEIGCRACHGSPSVPTSRLASAMLPVPPYLPRVVGDWSDAELFEVVKHGIKFTGMPAWPSQRRDDEVWAMVAFLRALPAMRPAEYRRLVGADGPSEAAPTGPLGVQRPPEVTERCGPCHGVTGEGRGSSAFPALAGQSERYLLATLEAFARGARQSGIMQPVAAELDDAQRRALARYYAALRPTTRPPASAPDAAPIARGEQIARRGVPASRVPACVQCHGPGGAPRNPNYPTLAGQYADHLALQLTLFQRGDRGGAAYARVMQRAAQGLTREEIRDVARYYASLPAPP